MVKRIEGLIEAHRIPDYDGNDINFIDIYDKNEDEDLYDITSYFHGKKVRITIEEIERN